MHIYFCVWLLFIYFISLNILSLYYFFLFPGFSYCISQPIYTISFYISFSYFGFIILLTDTCFFPFFHLISSLSLFLFLSPLFLFQAISPWRLTMATGHSFGGGSVSVGQKHWSGWNSFRRNCKTHNMHRCEDICVFILNTDVAAQSLLL